MKPSAPPTAKQIAELTEAYNRVGDEAVKARQLIEQREHALGGDAAADKGTGKDPLLVESENARLRQLQLSGGNQPPPVDSSVEERKRQKEEEAKSLLSSPLYEQAKTISLNDEPAAAVNTP